MNARIAAVVLAAGRSSRFGRNKLLEPLGTKLLIRHSVDAAAGAGLFPIIVITGRDSAKVAACLPQEPAVQLVVNDLRDHGMASSLRCGLAALPADLDGVAVCLGDMPLITSATLSALIGHFLAAKRPSIIVPIHGGRRGHPVIFASAFFAHMDLASGDNGARHVLEAHPDRIIEVIAGPEVLTDIDTVGDLTSLSRV